MRSILFLLLVLPLAASAQPTFGAKAGLSVANLYGFEEADLEGIDKRPILGFTGGLTAQFPLSPSLAVRPEVLFTQKGTQLSGADDDPPTEATQTIRINYVEVPVMVRVSVPVGPFADAGVLVGPSVGFKVSESVTLEQNGVQVNDPDLSGDSVTSFDAGLAFGAEYGSGPFAVEARYTAGLLDINDDDDGEPSIRNGVFSITGAFRFGR